MSGELNWGLPVIAYLFLAGLGAGAYTVSSSVLLRGGGGGFGGYHFVIARYGAMVAPIMVIVGCALLILELGSFEAGNYFRFLNLFRTINLSPMSIGSWLLVLFIIASLAYAYTFLSKDARPDDSQHGLRRALAWIGVPLGIAVGVYTGVLLGAMPARPFWNSPILALLFLVSSLSTGIAAIMLIRALIANSNGEASERDYHQSGYLLTASDTILIGFELLVVFLFLMFAHLTVGDVKYAVSVVLPGGPVSADISNVAAAFWIGVVVLGLLVPGLVELKYVIPRLLHHQRFAAPRGVEILVPVIVLIGGFLLRYVVVTAGQITGMTGI